MSQTLREPRRAFRDRDDRLLGGVAAGVGAHLGVEPTPARVGFVVLALLGGFGVVVYAALWVLLPVRDCDDAMAAQAPGLGSATRRGLRTGTARQPRRDLGIALSLGLVGLGGVVLLQNAGLWVSPRLFWPLLVAGSGVALLWWQSDQGDRTEWLTTGNGWKAWLRVAVGVALVGAAVWLVLFQAGVSGTLDDVVGAILLAVGGLALVIGPWLLRLSRDLRRERSARIRSQERADVAAHLHDSVLQTLALIQRQAGDPRTVTQLARTQERELRIWLFDTVDPEGTTLRAALQRAVSEVEMAHRVPIELVMVGDAAPGDAVSALVAATREAMVNAARHSGAARIDVYAEVQPNQIEVGVRDRGAGFDLAEVAADRRGVRGSIIDRMNRHGGTAEVRSSPDAGTEIRMCLPLSKQQGEPTGKAAPTGKAEPTGKAVERNS